MTLEERLIQRADNKCELCATTKSIQLYEVPPQTGRGDENCIMVCDVCLSQLEKKAEPDSTHWSSCLPTSMWSEIPAVQVVAWRMLNRFRNESWATDNLDMLYLDDEKLAWAKATG